MSVGSKAEKLTLEHMFSVFTPISRHRVRISASPRGCQSRKALLLFRRSPLCQADLRNLAALSFRGWGHHIFD